MSCNCHLYQIVFCPYARKHVLTGDVRRDIYTMIYHQFLRFNAFVHRIGGMSDHIHIIVEIPARYAVADIIKIVKQEASRQIKEDAIIREWEGWQQGYGSFSYNKQRDLNALIEYVKNQAAHHKNLSFEDEYMQLSGHNPYSQKGEWWW